jgi:enamine deaminase RidA (YjgF/YER057c/UK114 family)
MSGQKKIIDVPGLFDSRKLGYEQCVSVGNLIFVAGQGGDLDEQFRIAAPDFETQARQALANVRRAIEAAGGTPADIVAMTVYYTDIGNLRAFGAIRRELMPELQMTSTSVEVSRLALPGMLVEVTVIAVRSGS